MKDFAPSTERNREAILGQLRQALPEHGRVLEIASGTGQHAVFFATHLPQLSWQPTDQDERALTSIRAWAAEAELGNLQEPLHLNATDELWPVRAADAIVNINMLHISPWAACEGLMRGAAQILSPGGPLFYYGAFFRKDRQTAPSNLEFDATLRQRNGAWGVRWLEEVVATAQAAGLSFEQVIDMPNNNYVLILRQPLSER